METPRSRAANLRETLTPPMLIPVICSQSLVYRDERWMTSVLLALQMRPLKAQQTMMSLDIDHVDIDHVLLYPARATIAELLNEMI